MSFASGDSLPSSSDEESEHFYDAEEERVPQPQLSSVDPSNNHITSISSDDESYDELPAVGGLPSISITHPTTKPVDHVEFINSLENEEGHVEEEVGGNNNDDNSNSASANLGGERQRIGSGKFISHKTVNSGISIDVSSFSPTVTMKTESKVNTNEVVSPSRLEYTVEDSINHTKAGTSTSVANRQENEEDVLNSIIVKNLDTGEQMTLLDAEKSVNPIYKQMVLRCDRIGDKHNDNDSDSADSTDKKKKDKKKKKKDSPHEPHDPTKIKVETEHKSVKELNDLHCVQNFSAHAGTIWCMKFSPSGKYLATGSQDGYVHVWRVLGQGEEPLTDSTDQTDTTTNGKGSLHIEHGSTEAKVTGSKYIDQRPYRKYLTGTQEGDVLDLAWSMSHFLITSTMDNKVRVFHISRDECLMSFKHSDIATSVAFHPLDEALFMTGSFDEKLRIFTIRDRALLQWQDTRSMITAVAFSPDGRIAIAGTYDGKCLFYHTEGMVLITKLEIRSRRGRNKGKKVTGIVFTPSGDKFMVTTNDSRVRLYYFHDYSIYCKYEGLKNKQSQIRATFSILGEYIISGSEDRKVYVWNTENRFIVFPKLGRKRKDRSNCLECFSSHSSTITNALFAPFNAYLPHDGHTTKTANNSKKSKKSNFSDDKKYIETMAGTIIVTADFRGNLQVFENRGEGEDL